MSSTSRSAKSRTICRPASIACCRSSPMARWQGYPRVFGVAWALVAHTDSAFDVQKLTRFVRGVSARPAAHHRRALGDRDHAAHHAGGKFAPAGRSDRRAPRRQPTGRRDRGPYRSAPKRASPSPPPRSCSSLDQVPWSTAFAVQLAQRLRDRDPNVTPALRWLNDRLAAEETTTDQIVREEVQRQSAMNVTVRNVITSMRLISMINWAGIVRKREPGRRDPARRKRFRRHGFSDARSLSPRDRAHCAHSADQTRSRSPRQACGGQPAKRAARVGPRTRSRLLSDFERAATASKTAGRPRLPSGTRSSASMPDRRASAMSGMIARGHRGRPALALVSVAQTGLPRLGDRAPGISGRGSGLGCRGRDRSIASSPRVSARLCCPGWSCATACRPNLRSIVVVPTLLTSADSIDEQIERLEVHHLSNPDDNFISRCCRTGADSPNGTCPRLTNASSPPPQPELPGSTSATGRRNERHASSFSTAGASGTKAKGNGSAGSASAASCTN